MRTRPNPPPQDFSPLTNALQNGQSGASRAPATGLVDAAGDTVEWIAVVGVVGCHRRGGEVHGAAAKEDATSGTARGVVHDPAALKGRRAVVVEEATSE